jgi:hypothetical protein
MSQARACGWTLLCASILVSPLCAQDVDRIWGRVRTASGDVHEGFIRWDRNEGSWVDILDGSKEIPDVNYRVWLAANDEEPAVRSIELRGYRISWDEEDPDFPSSMPSGVRFGHIAALTVAGEDRVELELRSGERVELSGGATDIGRSIREIVVDVPGRDEIELRWRDLERVDFSSPPAGAQARARRLFGTAEDVTGRRFTGYISWDLDEILESDVLDGEEIEGGRERDIRFDEISEIERIDGGARVTLRRGGTIDLTGSNDVDRGHRGVQVSDPTLGMVEVEWREFRTLRFHEPDAVADYGTFDGGHELRGTVSTTAGEEIAGTIRWDADEAASWEFLNGRSHDVAFTVELSFVDRIERGEAFGATVVLTDGRTLELEDTSDVDWDNRGILVAGEGASAASASSWRVIAWEDLREVRFRHGGDDDRREGGR